MATREDRIRVFEDTEYRCANNPDLVASIKESRKGTKVYREWDYPSFFAENHFKTNITVSSNRSFEAAKHCIEEDPDSKIGVLNFANAFRPGGGVRTGSSAQEESLCRCSTLYALLDDPSMKTGYYDYHRRIGSSAATDAVIYTPSVTVFKTDTAIPEVMKKKDWITVDILTCAAPDLRLTSNIHAALNGSAVVMSKQQQFGYHVRRAIHLLTVAAANHIDTLVLGAFGCGAFENDPETVARAYKTALQEFDGVFMRVEFAIYCSPGHTDNYDIFRSILL